MSRRLADDAQLVGRWRRFSPVAMRSAPGFALGKRGEQIGPDFAGEHAQDASGRSQRCLCLPWP